MVKSDITSHPTYPHIQLLLALDLAIERIRVRVIEGGHGIPVHAITRRYYTGLKIYAISLS